VRLRRPVSRSFPRAALRSTPARCGRSGKDA
jgi:hypothetical protein